MDEVEGLDNCDVGCLKEDLVGDEGLVERDDGSESDVAKEAAGDGEEGDSTGVGGGVVGAEGSVEEDEKPRRNA